MGVLIFYVSALATASPCVTYADRPVGGRLHIWDITDGRVDDADVLASERRIAELANLQHIALPPDVPPNLMVDTRVRLANLYAAEGKFRIRCDPESGAAEPWFLEALRLTEMVLDEPLGPARSLDVLRTRADALCGLQRWDSCITAVSLVAARSQTPAVDCEVLYWTGWAHLARRDYQQAVDTFRRASPHAYDAVCAGTLYGEAWGSQRMGAIDEALMTMVMLANVELLRAPDVLQSSAFQAAMLDIPNFRRDPADAQPGMQLIAIEPIVADAVGARIRTERRRSREQSTETAVGSLLRMGLLESSLSLVVAFEEGFQDSPALRRRPHAHVRRESPRSANDSLEGMIAAVYDVAVETHDEVIRVAGTAPPACRAVELYLGRFPNGPRAEAMRRFIEGSADCNSRLVGP